MFVPPSGGHARHVLMAEGAHFKRQGDQRQKAGDQPDQDATVGGERDTHVLLVLYGNSYRLSKTDMDNHLTTGNIQNGKEYHDTRHYPEENPAWSNKQDEKYDQVKCVT